ncbi:hypothetical protein [Leeuwenhoekiella nanhaiensis]|uniref:Uncharacterized protein n=1 Tax=Leeuwenhoekiella nanhaiensis TaxID=1655491 RepID=A0A2G1VLQ8_9FLAO|nr:hypothetical protein [Leeuwenhoekiella nanhaiensis]PHQ27702.1 hypothetical protein CJ305_18725 [Leeuwenhoekiella nanhaiensis]
MTDWREIDKTTILTGTDENGNRYLSRFLKEYQQTFQPDMINAGCQRCLDDYYNNFIKYLNTMGTAKNDSGYILKAKYEGIPLEFGSQTFVRNSTITKKQGDFLLKNHKRGEELFEQIPENAGEPEVTGDDALKELLKLERKELNEKADALGLDGKSYANKGEVAQAILDKEAEAVKTPTEPAADANGDDTDTDAGDQDDAGEPEVTE